MKPFLYTLLFAAFVSLNADSSFAFSECYSKKGEETTANAAEDNGMTPQEFSEFAREVREGKKLIGQRELKYMNGKSLADLAELFPQVDDMSSEFMEGELVAYLSNNGTQHSLKGPEWNYVVGIYISQYPPNRDPRIIRFDPNWNLSTHKSSSYRFIHKEKTSRVIRRIPTTQLKKSPENFANQNAQKIFEFQAPDKTQHYIEEIYNTGSNPGSPRYGYKLKELKDDQKQPMI